MNGFPLSKVSKDARYTLSLSIKSANLFNSLPRSDASIVRHGDPRRKAYYVIDIQNDKSFGFLINNIRILQDKRKFLFQFYLCCSLYCFVYIGLISFLNMANNFFCDRIHRRECLKGHA